MSKSMMVGVLMAAAFSLFAAEQPKPYGGKGVLAFVNVCGAPQASLEAAAKTMKNILLIKTEVKDGTWSLIEARQSVANAGATAAVFVIRDKSMPPSLVAMEDKWGIVNAEGLSDYALEKETLRVATLVMGAAYSKYSASVLRPLFSPADFKPQTNVCDVVTFDVLLNMDGSLRALGFEPFRLLTREEAEFEGFIKK